MRTIGVVTLRLVLIALALAAAARAALFLVYAWFQARTPIEAYHLEPKMVSLAWRVREGLPLYPRWDDLPNYEANFFGPLYFVLVGHLARLVGPDLHALTLIGRWTTVASGLAAALLVGWAARRRSGLGAGVVAALQSLGAAPMAGFGVMVRPDLMADTFGFAGFLLGVGSPGRRGWRLILAGLFLVAAVLTKQTAGLYLPAAALGLILTKRRVAALSLAGGVLGSLGLIVAAITLTVEPRFFADLLGEGRSPIAPADWSRNLGRLATLAPDLIVLSLAGLIAWLTPSRRDLPLAALTVVLWAGAVATSLKIGADLNYFLGARLVAALALASLWGPSWRLPAKARPSTIRLFAQAAALACLLAAQRPGLIHARSQAELALAFDRFNGEGGRRGVAAYRELFRVAEDPRKRLLTDCGFLALRQGTRAPFVDPWLFRMRVDRGLLDPVALRRELAAGSYDVLVTTHELHAPSFDTMSFSLPPTLAAAARPQYRPTGQVAGLYIYEPIRPAGSAPAEPLR